MTNASTTAIERSCAKRPHAGIGPWNAALPIPTPIAVIAYTAGARTPQEHRARQHVRQARQGVGRLREQPPTDVLAVRLGDAVEPADQRLSAPLLEMTSSIPATVA